MAVGKESNKEKHRQSKSFPPDLMGAHIVLHFRIRIAIALLMSARCALNANNRSEKIDCDN
ncbi:hypothetical protein DAPPUDRAFT_248332 [Daphnia pulex]|uniref:Uncharacterized protein n=1 Tax=Daphnia pulex TaxID=6669 RepID=E9GU68_DAPPU|nr:hypothetical protein DAPPUDRAFT_248332 [Daphnia pulex]|eukprot:EFX77024.1 hypothetical protein DAPPUDRAFT_248332 [Daphnia pulex]